MSFIRALENLRPGAQWSWPGQSYSDLTWLSPDVTKPTYQEILNEAIAIESNAEANQYKEQRAAAYPPIADQLDMLWHALNAGALDTTSTFYTALKVVKDTYPKP